VKRQRGLVNGGLGLLKIDVRALPDFLHRQIGCQSETQFCPKFLRAEAEITIGADRKSTRLNSSHGSISYAVFCLKKKNTKNYTTKHKSNRIRKTEYDTNYLYVWMSRAISHQSVTRDNHVCRHILGTDLPEADVP